MDILRQHLYKITNDTCCSPVETESFLLLHSTIPQCSGTIYTSVLRLLVFCSVNITDYLFNCPVTWLMHLLALNTQLNRVLCLFACPLVCKSGYGLARCSGPTCAKAGWKKMCLVSNTAGLINSVPGKLPSCKLSFQP